MFEMQTSNLCEARFLVSDLKFVVVTKVSLSQTDDDDAGELGRADEQGGNEMCR